MFFKAKIILPSILLALFSHSSPPGNSPVKNNFISRTQWKSKSIEEKKFQLRMVPYAGELVRFQKKRNKKIPTFTRQAAKKGKK
ncbi:hypothetical protein ACFL35_16265 [Candidatus Riflebacteria bacterium]